MGYLRDLAVGVQPDQEAVYLQDRVADAQRGRVKTLTRGTVPTPIAKILEGWRHQVDCS